MYELRNIGFFFCMLNLWHHKRSILNQDFRSWTKPKSSSTIFPILISPLPNFSSYIRIERSRKANGNVKVTERKCRTPNRMFHGYLGIGDLIIQSLRRGKCDDTLLTLLAQDIT